MIPLGPGWKEGKRLRRLARCHVYLQPDSGAIHTCKTAEGKGKLLVALADVQHVRVRVDHTSSSVSSSSSSAADEQSVTNPSKTSGAPRSPDDGGGPKVYFKFVPNPSTKGGTARILAFATEDSAYGVWNALAPLTRTFGFDLQDLDDVVAQKHQPVGDGRRAPDANGNAGDIDGAEDSDPQEKNEFRVRVRTNSVGDFVEDEEDDAATLSSASSSGRSSVSSFSTSPSSQPAPSATTSAKNSMPRHQRLHEIFLSPRRYSPLTDIVVYETRRWIYLFGRCDPEVIKGNDNRASVGAETMAPFLSSGSGGGDAKGEYAAAAAATTTAPLDAAAGADLPGTARRASNISGSRAEFHLMKISRRDDLSDDTSQSLEDLVVFDPHKYTAREVRSLVRTLKVIALSEGDSFIGPNYAVAVLGFVRFLRGFYLVLATERSLLGNIAGHAVYGVASSQVLQVWRPVEPPESSSLLGKLRRGISKQFSSKSPLDAAESKYRALFSLVDLTKDFFFSYTYSLTHTVQTNLDASRAAHGSKMARERDHRGRGSTPEASAMGAAITPPSPSKHPQRSQQKTIKHGVTEDGKVADDVELDDTAYELGVNDRFVWNRHLAKEFLALDRGEASPGLSRRWTIVLLHGSFSQRECVVFGKRVNITLVARRSRHFAGTRYLKRGVTEDGKVANDVEIEQIVESVASGRITSHVQVRGSIPVFWTQETSATNPKPPIVVQRQDPTFEAATRHFCDLFERYAEPVVVLDLVRSAENEGPKNRRESLVGDLFRMAVTEINSQLPVELGIRYKPLDFKAMSKHTDSKGRFVFDWLFALAEEALQLHGFCSFEPEQMLPGSGLKTSSFPSSASSSSSAFLSSSPEGAVADSPAKAPAMMFDPMQFHFGPCTTKKSEALLKGRRVGTFLLRDDGSGIQVLSYVTSAQQVGHAVLFQHPRTRQYRLPDGHWVSTLDEVICSFGSSRRNELRAGLRYAGHSHFAKEQDLDFYFGKAARNHMNRTKMRKAESATSGSRSRTDLSDMAAVARKLQQPGIYDRLVQDRRYRMRIYRRCFKANELITAMLENGFCRTRQEGVALGQRLQRSGHIHHVLDHHDFQDARLFFRWFNDEARILAKSSVIIGAGNRSTPDGVVGDGERSRESTAAGRGLFTRLEIDYAVLATEMRRGLVVKDRLYRGTMYKKCFVGRDAVAWLAAWIKRKQRKGTVGAHRGKPSADIPRFEAVALGRALLAVGMIRHITSAHTFKDGTLLYTFVTNESGEFFSEFSPSSQRSSPSCTAPLSSRTREGPPVASAARSVRNSHRSRFLKQRGVVRSNCIDCLDRTNVAQWCIGMRMLACQLYVLGVDLCLKRPNGMSLGSSRGVGDDEPEFGRSCFTQRLSTAELVLAPKSKVAQVITQMWETLGDRIALQYGGSEAHKKVTGQAVSSGGENGNKKKRKTAEVLTSIRRYYSNSFTDRPKQDAMNLFLGMFQPMAEQQYMEELETLMESRTWATEERGDPGKMLARRSKSMRRRNTRRATQNEAAVTSGERDIGPDSASVSRRMFHFQHLWELEGDSLPSDFYLHNKRAMEARRSESLDSILAALSRAPGSDHSGTVSSSSEKSSPSSSSSSPSLLTSSIAAAEEETRPPSVTRSPSTKHDEVSIASRVLPENRGHLAVPHAQFKSMDDLPYFQKANESRLKEDWWAVSLNRFEEKANRVLRLFKLPSSKPVRETITPSSVQGSAGNQELLIAFDSLKISSNVTSGFSSLLELEEDIVGHNGSMEIGRVHEYESLRMTPSDFGLPFNAPSLVADMRRAYEDLRAPSLRALGLYRGGDVDSSVLASRSDLLAEIPVMWQHRRRKPGARMGSNTITGESKLEYSRVHMLQQFWSVPEYVSAGLVVAPEKDWNTCHNLAAEERHKPSTKERTVADSDGRITDFNRDNEGEDRGRSSRGSLKASRSSVFHGVLETFGLRGGFGKDGKTMLQAAQDTAGGAHQDKGGQALADLASRLSPELPIDRNDIVDYQKYVARGQNSWHEGLRAEESLFEELHGYDNGLPDKRTLEIFRHAKYLHADPHDLEAMRMVQSAGGATLVIKHGAFRGLRQDSPAVETKAALESLLWRFETADKKVFEASLQIRKK